MPQLFKLPPELWVIIFDFVIEPTLDPAGMCSATNFPQTHLHLHSPRQCGPIEDPHSQLKLVCRSFRAMVGPSPYFFIVDTDAPIPATARSIYGPLMPKGVLSAGYLKRVLVDPYRSRRIVTLFLGCTRSIEQKILPFDELCECSRALTNLRNLTLSIFYLHPLRSTTQLWSRLPKAFPLLVSLVLHSMQKPLAAAPAHVADESSSVIFEQLEILDLGCFVVSPFVRFPALRHAASNIYSPITIDVLAHSTLLESFLMRDVEYTGQMDLKRLPQLVSVGFPKRSDSLALPVPIHYPLRHICIYMVSWFAWSSIIHRINILSKRFPLLSRITIDLTPLSREDRMSFLDEELRGTGFTVVNAVAKGMLIILDRVPVITQPALVPRIEGLTTTESSSSSDSMHDSQIVPGDTQPRPATRGKRLKQGLGKFFRKLRL